MSKQRRIPRQITAAILAALAMAVTGCNGGGKPVKQKGGGASGLRLLKVEYGRLVDIYAYRRVDPKIPDRREVTNRKPVLIERDVVVSPSIETEPLFDSVGEERVAANFRFLPFDVAVGHEELLILWDDTVAGERERFRAALEKARGGLAELPAAYRDQNVVKRPIPVVPRNAALRLTFSGPLPVSTAFFEANPAALQLLEFEADPKTTSPDRAFRPLPKRVIVRGDTLIVDTTLIGRESRNGQTSVGLPPSPDNVSANIRLAIPTTGILARQLKVEPDTTANLNGLAADGSQAVIRDFRSGNDKDGRVGALTDLELPMIVADVGMGIMSVDRQSRILTLNKRFSQVAVRGRVPFVDGGIVRATGLPGGPSKVPTEIPLRAGDLLIQEVVSPQTGETVRIRAEIVKNLDVGTVIGDPAFPSLGIARDGSDGGSATTVRVQVASLTAFDSQGNEVSFQASDLPLGADCTVRVHYYHNIPYNSAFGSFRVSDAGRITSFVVFDPEPPLLDKNRQPIPRGTHIDPNANVALRFSEPMDLESVDPLKNLVITDTTFTAANFVELIQQAKPAGLSIVAARLVDQERDGTLLKLSPPMGHFHEQGKAETYWFHMLVGKGGPKDLAGNPVDLFDRRLNAAQSLSVSYQLSDDPKFASNLVGWKLYRFEDPDEDGTPPGSVDFFGQFQMRDGRLFAAETTRFSRVADAQTLAPILRYDKGECYFEGRPANPPAPAIPAGTIPPNLTQPPGVLYWTPSMTAVQPVPPRVFTPPQGPKTFGGMVEPHNPRGARLQMTYREDDFFGNGLGYHDASTFLIDIEQLHWANWNNNPIQFDVFDRYTLKAAHADWRPDLRFFLTVPQMGSPTCDFDCASLFSGLRARFVENALQGSKFATLLEDKVYRINPSDAFRSSTGTTFVPYPKFDRTYTWRDSRLVTWDMTENKAIGLGGAKTPDGQFPNRDRTANVSSPWIQDEPKKKAQGAPGSEFNGPVWNLDEGDFWGDRIRDLDPIAMPLVLDFFVYPDDPSNGIATGVNQFHVALVGPVWTPTHPGGYYNAAGAVNQMRGSICGGNDWPWFRTWYAGGVDGLGQEYLVDPANTHVAKQSWIKDVGLGDPINGRYQTKPGDGTTHWAQADFVRRVSMVTFGFFDTLQPNRHGLTAGNFKTKWPGLGQPGGFPDFQKLGGQFRVKDMIAVMDPPLTGQPPGTSVEVQFRGAETFANADKIYDRAADDKLETRGNLLNPNYACEAYRYAMPNAGKAKDTPRVRAQGLTPYVVEEKLDEIRDRATKLLPRYVNLRLVLENNTNVSPALSPSLRSLMVVYRLSPR